MNAVESQKSFTFVSDLSPPHIITMYAAFVQLGRGQSQAVLAFKNNEELVPVDYPNDGTTTLCTRLPQKAELPGLYIHAGDG